MKWQWAKSSAASLTFPHYAVLLFQSFHWLAGEDTMAPVVPMNYVRFVSACEIQWVAHATGHTVLKRTWYSHGKAKAQTQTRLAPVMTGFVCTVSSAIRRQLRSGETSRNENRVRSEKFWPVIQLHTGCWNHVMANKGLRKFALHSVHLFFNRAQTIRNNGTCVIHVAELNTLQYAANW
jgi:hypothetical protein